MNTKTFMSEVIENQPNATTVMGTGGAVGVLKAPSKKREWFIARVSPNTEKSSRDRLLQMGVEAFVASQEEYRFYKNGDRKKPRKKKVERAVITQYVFIHITEIERRRLVEEPFIRCFLIDRTHEERTFATVSDEKMHQLKLMLGYQDAQVQFAAADYTIGEEVTVKGFGSQEYTGHVVRLRGDKTSYIGVRIDVLGCAYLEIAPQRLAKKQ